MKTPYSKVKMLNDNHWKKEAYAQRMKTKDWKLILLNNDDQMTFEGRVRRLVAKNIGYGLVEVSKEKKK